MKRRKVKARKWLPSHLTVTVIVPPKKGRGAKYKRNKRSGLEDQ